MASEEQIRLMRERITDEVFYALVKRKQGALRCLFGGLVRLPTTRFARIFAEADEHAAAGGLPEAGQSLAQSLGVRVGACGAEQIPAEGPLLVVSNHPGAYDSAVLCACIPRRDLKIIVYEIPFYRAFPNISRQMIFATDDTAGRMLALRAAVQHLQAGGAVLQFGTGKIDPDPAVQAGAEGALAGWLASIEVMLRKAPLTGLVLAAVSGVLQRRFAEHPLTRLHRDAMDRRRLAEFMQVIWQLIRPASVSAQAMLSFAPPVAASALAAEAAGQRLMQPILARAQALLGSHIARFGGVR